MLSRTLSAAVLLACSAAILPAYAENTKEEPARATGAPTAITAAEHTNAHSAVTQSPMMPAPAFTTVITAEEMQDNHYETVAEALAYAPGLTVTPVPSTPTIRLSALTATIASLCLSTDGNRIWQAVCPTAGPLTTWI